MAALHITQKRMREPDSMKKVIFDKEPRGFTQTDTFTDMAPIGGFCLLNARVVAL